MIGRDDWKRIIFDIELTDIKIFIVRNIKSENSWEKVEEILVRVFKLVDEKKERVGRR